MPNREQSGNFREGNQFRNQLCPNEVQTHRREEKRKPIIKNLCATPCHSNSYTEIRRVVAEFRGVVLIRHREPARKTYVLKK